MTPEQVYAFYFHGPAYRVVASAWRDGERSAAALADPLPDNHRPAELPLTIAPRLIELCFQTAGLWEAGLEDRLALPMGITKVLLLRLPTKAPGPLHATARPIGDGGFDCSVLDAKGRVILRLEGYRTVPMPAPIPAEIADVLRATFRR
jgi:hypothetical protein